MGREWLYWVGGGMGRPSTRGRRVSAEMKEAEETSAGCCMCSVFQLLDLHPFQLPLNQQHPSSFDSPFLQEEATTSKGVEAPRNSLELGEQVASMPLAMKVEENLNFPAGIGQIKTRSRTEDFPSEFSSNSPGLKTPNLVARLMGLDLLPEGNSPSFSPSNPKPPKNFHFNQRKDRSILQNRPNRCFSDDDISVGAQSLPETPRISSARRSDVELIHHRLSLQINEESSISAKMVDKKGRRFRQLIQENENRSPGNYAKQIVKQVKESVSRRVGLIDITNTNRSDKEETIRRDQNLVLLKPTKRHSSSGDQISSKPKFSDTKSPRTSTSSDNQGIPSSLRTKKQEIMQENQQQQQRQRKEIEKVGTGDTLKKFPPQAIRKKKEEPFVHSAATNKANLTDKKSKKAPLSTELLNINGPTPTLMPVKKVPSPPATKLPQKQSQVSNALSSKRNTQLSSNSSHSYPQLNLETDKIFTVPGNVLPDNTNGCATTASAAAAAEYRYYIQRILKRAGIIDKVTPLTLGKWHTSSHPLDPSIFYYLELFHPAAASSSALLSRRCNRKLIFQLVDELLAEILRPHFDFKLWASPVSKNYDHFALVDELCKKVESFPAANCQVLEDIDSLIDKDMRKSELNGFLEEEGESLVCEIEGEIVQSLVCETVAMVGVRTEGEQRQRLVEVTWEAFT